MDSQENNFSKIEVTHSSVSDSADSRQVEELCALLASRNGLETAGNSKSTGSRQSNTFATPAPEFGMN